MVTTPSKYKHLQLANVKYKGNYLEMAASLRYTAMKPILDEAVSYAFRLTCCLFEEEAESDVDTVVKALWLRHKADILSTENRKALIESLTYDDQVQKTWLQNIYKDRGLSTKQQVVHPSLS